SITFLRIHPLSLHDALPISRAQMFVRALAVDHAERCELVALADPNPARVRAHNDDLAALGAPRAAEYDAADVVAMLAKERVDVLLVTTIDRVHDEYIVAALENGCAVVTEKPMTIDVPRCQRILDAARRTGRSVRVTFNYRYNPLHERVREVLAAGEIGEVSSVHFEWLLDRKSTRLNSSHVKTSYAVFFLKKQTLNKKRHQK